MGFSFGDLQSVEVAAGRGDGKARVYVGDDAGDIHEFTYVSDHWEKNTISTTLSSIIETAIGDGRNEGVPRIYATGYNIGEYGFGAGAWTGLEIGPYVQWTNGIAMGDGRHDGEPRLYVAGWGELIELSWGGGGWVATTTIDTSNKMVDQVVVTDARNDGTPSVYAMIDAHVLEFVWGTSSFTTNDCGAIGAGLVTDMVAGNGRSDGLDRIYIASGNGFGIHELSHGSSGWTISEVSSTMNPAGLAIGAARNDGVQRLYAGESQYVHQVVEFSFVSNQWMPTNMLDINLAAVGIAVGPGRGDGVQRVYVLGNDKHVYEYSCH